jgi:voltage-gated potassium channel
LRELYEGGSRRSAWFRYGLLLFDVATIFFLVLTSFIDGSPVLELVDAAIGIIIFADFHCSPIGEPPSVSTTSSTRSGSLT